MGLLNEIVGTVIHKSVEHLSKKDPVLVVFIDNLDEMTLLEAVNLYRDKKKQLFLAQPTSFRAVDETPGIDWFSYFFRLTREPLTVVLKDFIKDQGLDEVMDVSISDALDSATQIGEDNK